eukprot:TRINITY_DN65333_c0_g1_i1.p1 TRINITY_DN65333_c0_g1~~TRINITY_DN65333_c0_g1_i1.p1  ORF type:complete len:232 (-),score=48.05 TRINITY_DN65333_c0_g1_i1:287-922(-)
MADIQGLEANLVRWSGPRIRRIRNPALKPFVLRWNAPSSNLEDYSSKPKQKPAAMALSLDTHVPLPSCSSASAVSKQMSSPATPGLLVAPSPPPEVAKGSDIPACSAPATRAMQETACLAMRRARTMLPAVTRVRPEPRPDTAEGVGAAACELELGERTPRTSEIPKTPNRGDVACLLGAPRRGPPQEDMPGIRTVGLQESKKILCPESFL